MKKKTDSIWQTIQNQPLHLIQWRRETVIRQTKSGYHFYLSLYLPDFPSTTAPDLKPFLTEQLVKTMPDLDKQSAVFYPLSLGEQVPDSYLSVPFLIIDIADVMSRPTMFQHLAQSKTHTFILYVSDTALLPLYRRIDKQFQFIYGTPQALNNQAMDKCIYHLKSVDDYQGIKKHLPALCAGPFVEAILAQKRFQHCPFSSDCTTLNCARFATYPAELLKCANPDFLIQQNRGKSA